MSLALRKHVFKEYIYVKILLKLLSLIKCSKFCGFFTLRQGTIIIATFELSLTSFCLFLLTLGVTHAQDIAALVTSDLQHLEATGWTEKNFEESLTYTINNEKKMIIGQHLAFIIMFTVWAGLLLAGIHFISCALQLYGAIRNSPNFLLPWILTALFSLLSGFFFITTLAFVSFQEHKVEALCISISLYGMKLYAWLVVLSYYQEIKA